MATVYTVRLALSSGLDNVAVLLFKAPSGYAWVVRDVVVYLPVASTTFIMQLVVPGVTNSPLWSFVGATPQTHHLELRQRMEQGDELYGQAVGGTFSISVTGYQLAL